MSTWSVIGTQWPRRNSPSSLTEAGVVNFALVSLHSLYALLFILDESAEKGCRSVWDVTS